MFSNYALCCTFFRLSAYMLIWVWTWRLFGPSPGIASCILKIFHMPLLSTAVCVSITKRKNMLLLFPWLGPAWAHSTHSCLSKFDTHSKHSSVIHHSSTFDHPSRCDITFHEKFYVSTYPVFSPLSERGRGRQSWDGGSHGDCRTLMGLALHGPAAGNWGKSYSQ